MTIVTVDATQADRAGRAEVRGSVDEHETKHGRSAGRHDT
jgi:hypothetical protein